MSYTSYYASVAMSAFLASVFACGLGIVFLRIRGAYFAIGSYALTAALANLVFYWQSNTARTTSVLVPVQDNSTVLHCMLAITLITIATAYLIKNSKLGLGLFAIREDEDAAEAAGVNTTLYKVVAFGICGLLMGATGAAVVARLGYVDVYGAFEEYISIYPVVMGLFGGIGTVSGPIIGAVVLRSIFEVFFGSGNPYPFEIALALLLIGIIMFVPSGFPEIIRHLSRMVRSKPRD
jgi:branched-chain amino acid transport system permease protein